MFKKILIGILLTSFSMLSAQEKLGEIDTHGIAIKDKLILKVFEDPTIKGISCYITLPFDPFALEVASDVAVFCVKTGQIVGNFESQKNIFSQRKNPFFKILHVDRIFDHRRRTLVYVAYTTALREESHAHAISVVTVD